MRWRHLVEGRIRVCRDADGRLVWGVNDFDEAYPLPYTSDLVRLATSTLLAIKSDRLTIARGDACEAILSSYEKGLAPVAD